MANRYQYHPANLKPETHDLLKDTTSLLKAVQQRTQIAHLPRLTKSVVVGVGLTMLLESLELQDGYIIAKAIARFQEIKQHHPSGKRGGVRKVTNDGTQTSRT